VSNLREIAHELNIGLDSLVFVDDNAFECQFVREQLPEVMVVELPSDVTRYARLLRGLGSFDALAISDEDRRRTQMYRSEARRTELRSSAGTMDDYLASLNMVLTISRGNAFSIPRIAQLTQKTNQFNLTTRRYSEGDISSMLADPQWRVYYAELEDTFDKSGIIAVALVHDADGIARIDTYLMSCRVIGRGVEQAVLARVAHDSLSAGSRLLVGEFLPTAKNELVASFYETAGFVPRDGAARQWWELSVAEADLRAPRWFREIRSGDAMVAV
jgi:FkbH-like protein